MTRRGVPCSCGDRSRPGLNHCTTKPCWGWIGDRRVEVDEDGEVVEEAS
jgi:hypothetical protein